MGTILDQALLDSDSAAFNPPGVEVKHISNRDIEFMTDDMLDRLLLDSRLLGDMIYGDLPYDGKDISLNCSQAKDLSCLISAILTCRRDDLPDHLESLRNLFTRNLQPMARDMAIEYLENEDE